MKFSVIHPTARVHAEDQFPWWGAESSAQSGCDNPQDVEYILVVHESRVREFRKNRVDWEGDFGRVSVVINHGRDCLVDQCNAGLLAAQGEIHIWNQDDMRYPEHWDTEILKLIPDTSQKICIQARTDGRRLDLLTLPTITTRALAHEIGALSADYTSMFSDDEFSAKARALGTVIPSKLYFQHLHPANGTAELDPVYASENSKEAYTVGREAFNRRRALGFPRVPIGNESQVAIQPAEAFRSIAFMLPGETFRFEWLSSLLELGIAVGNAGWGIQRFLGYSTSCYSTRINLTHDLLESKEQKPEYVFWLDDDNLVKPDQFLRLLQFLETHPEADGVTGWCWIRQKERWGTSVGKFWGDDGVHLCPMELPELFADNGSVKPIEHTGFPCFLMRYSVLEKLGENVFMPITKRDLATFVPGKTLSNWHSLKDSQVAAIVPHWFAGEDVAFCLRAREKGMQLYVDPMCKAAHLKTISQEPDVQLYGDTPEALKQWRAQVNGPAVKAPENYEVNV